MYRSCTGVQQRPTFRHTSNGVLPAQGAGAVAGGPFNHHRCFVLRDRVGDKNERHLQGTKRHDLTHGLFQQKRERIVAVAVAVVVVLELHVHVDRDWFRERVAKTEG